MQDSFAVSHFEAAGDASCLLVFKSEAYFYIRV